MIRRDSFQAIADPTRREILELIAHAPQNYNSIAENFTISRPAISKHLKILTECGLITIQLKGREKICTPRLDNLKEVSEWVNQYRRFWNQKLDALDQLLKKDTPSSRNIKSSKK